MYTEESLNKLGVYELRMLLRSLGGTPGNKRVSELCEEILKIQNGEFAPVHSKKGRKAKITAGEMLYDRERGELLKSKKAINKEDVKGVFEPLSDGSGYLRSDDYINDSGVFVSRTMVSDYGLEKGDYVVGQCERDGENRHYLSVMRTINEMTAKDFQRQDYFDGCEAIYPNKMLNLASSGDVSLRLVDLFAPIGLGQRSLILGGKKEGKTSLLSAISGAVKGVDKEIFTIALLLGVRPEDATKFKKQANPDKVVYIPTDETSDCCVNTSELILLMAKRLVESGKNVILFIDSISYLYTAYKQLCDDGEEALRRLRKYVMNAKNTENSGSLGIICTLVKDSPIADSLSEIANNVIELTTDYDIDVFPLIDALNSQTVSDSDLKSKEEYVFMRTLRRRLLKGELSYKDLVNLLENSRTNDEFMRNFDEPKS